MSRFDCGGVINVRSVTDFFCLGEYPNSNSRGGLLVPALGVTAFLIISISRLDIFYNAYMTQMGQLALRRPDFTFLTQPRLGGSIGITSRSQTDNLTSSFRFTSGYDR